MLQASGSNACMFCNSAATTSLPASQLHLQLAALCRQYARQADGNYIFLVQAVTASGLASAPAQYPFVIDTSPPSIDHVSFTSL